MPVVARNPVPWFIFVAAVVGIVLAYTVYSSSVAPRFEKSHHVLESPAYERMSLTIRYDAGPLVEETYEMSDRDGISASSYKATGRNGVNVAIDERPRKSHDFDTNVSFLFGQLVQDGIWDLSSKPPRGDSSTHYTIAVYQEVDYQHGGRTFDFTDPHYWATVAGHQFKIKLDKSKPVDQSVLNISSTVPVEPRYERLVADFRAFGPDTFRARIAAEKKRHFGVTT